MSRICSVCNKGRMTGNLVSHSNRHTPRKWMPNVQKVRVVSEGTVKSAYVCTRCLRSGKVQRAL